MDNCTNARVWDLQADKWVRFFVTDWRGGIAYSRKLDIGKIFPIMLQYLKYWWTICNICGILLHKIYLVFSKKTTEETAQMHLSNLIHIFKCQHFKSLHCENVELTLSRFAQWTNTVSNLRNKKIATSPIYNMGTDGTMTMDNNRCYLWKWDQMQLSLFSETRRCKILDLQHWRRWENQDREHL